MLHHDLKHEVTGDCLRSDKIRTASFLDVFKNELLNTLIRGESLEIYVF